jgi:hypothetical protein
LIKVRWMNPTRKVTWTRDVGNMLKPALVSCSTTSTTLYPIAEPFLPDDISVGRGGGEGATDRDTFLG